MQDEHFIRDWSNSHDAFSAGVTRMLAKTACDEAQAPDRGTELRYQHGNRLFVAMLAGLLAGLVVASTAAMFDGAPTHAPARAMLIQ